MATSTFQELTRAMQVLGVQGERDWDKVQAHYRQLVLRWHPDRHLGDTQTDAQNRFVAINGAYRLLRTHYQKTGQLPAAHVNAVPLDDGQFIKTRLRQEKFSRPSHWLRNPTIQACSIVLSVLIVFAVVLLMLDSRMVKKNRDRALFETVSISAEKKASSDPVPGAKKPIVHTYNSQDD